jgi:hypothetical protein
MIFNKLLPILFFVITISTGKIDGYVYDKNTNEELCGVQIITNNSDTTYTDFNGHFTINTQVTDTLVVDFKLISYEKKKMTIVNSLLTSN